MASPDEVNRFDRYVILIRQAPKRGPSYCRDKFYRIGVIETDGIHMPQMIHPRHKSTVLRIVRTWEGLRAAKTLNSAFGRAVREAVALAAKLNGVDESYYGSVFAHWGFHGYKSHVSHNTVRG